MLAFCCGACLCGLEAQPITVEVDLAPGLPGLQLVGLGDISGREARERVRSALRNSGFRVPQTRVVVSLAPAQLRKQGPSFDLPIALALLVATGQLPQQFLEGVWAAGELGLDGQLRPVRGVLAVARAAQAAGAAALIVPAANGSEAALVDGLKVWPAEQLSGVSFSLRSGMGWALPGAEQRIAPPPPWPDLGEVEGQLHGRRALEIAASGRHHLLMIGPPGCGKTLLARCLPSLLPPLDQSQALELTQIHSVAGLLPPEAGLLRQPPFRSPHHGCSATALVGGGSGPRPGELSLAHHGILFLDELAEFRREVLDQLRQPLESGQICLARARQSLWFPCRLLLAAATNPCPCGWWGDPLRPCRCGERLRRQYWSRLSGPLLDRLDLQVILTALPPAALEQVALPRQASDPLRETSLAVAKRVASARARMLRRNPGGLANAEVPFEQLRPHLRLSKAARRFWTRSLEQPLRLTARSVSRVLRVARTAADLEGSEPLDAHHLAEALTYRSLDRLAPDGMSAGI
jgi:magnesium chelatase family protein